MVALPEKSAPEGAVVRLLLAECRGPAYKNYNLADARLCMGMMHQVLWNRLKTPGRYNAKGAKVLVDIIKAKGQFAGFEKYPEYDYEIRNRLQEMVNIADSKSDKRRLEYEAFITAAINEARTCPMPDPSGRKLTGWRTANATHPGGSFLLHKTFAGIDFYYEE